MIMVNQSVFDAIGYVRQMHHELRGCDARQVVQAMGYKPYVACKPEHVGQDTRSSNDIFTYYSVVLYHLLGGTTAAGGWDRNALWLTFMQGERHVHKHAHGVS